MIVIAKAVRKKFGGWRIFDEEYPFNEIFPIDPKQDHYLLIDPKKGKTRGILNPREGRIAGHLKTGKTYLVCLDGG